MNIDGDFIKCTDGAYIARRLVARVECHEVTEHSQQFVLYDDHGNEIGRTKHDIVRSTLVPAMGWALWAARFDPLDPDKEWLREAEAIVAWEFTGCSCKPICAIHGRLSLFNFSILNTKQFIYLEEAWEGRRRYWAYYDIVFNSYDTLSDLDADIRSFVKNVNKNTVKNAGES